MAINARSAANKIIMVPPSVGMLLALSGSKVIVPSEAVPAHDYAGAMVRLPAPREKRLSTHDFCHRQEPHVMKCLRMP